MYSEEFYRIALQYVEGYGNATLKKMLRLSGSATHLFSRTELWTSALSKKRQAVPKPVISEDVRRKVDEELKLMEKHHVQLCFYLDNDYPYRMKNCTDAPISFFYKGSSDFNALHSLAVVGTREATEYGRNAVRKILSELKDFPLTTVSGLAYGIDTEAHTRSLEYGLKTVAVMGCGLGTIYPYQNLHLSEQIVDQGGTLISEYSFRTPPDRLNFPKRNRIIAGLSDAVLVVETANKGGSMITAYIAQSYNRDVFAVPGSVFDVHYDGCHELIRKNVAAILTSGNELVEMMNWESRQQNVQTSLFVELTKEEEPVVDLIRSANEISIDVLSENLSECSPSKLAGLLLGLELKGVIVCRPGKRYAMNAGM